MSKIRHIKNRRVISAVERFFGDDVVVLGELVRVIFRQQLTIFVIFVDVKVVGAVKVIGFERCRAVGTEPARTLPAEFFLEDASGSF